MLFRGIHGQAQKRFPPDRLNFWCHVTEGALASFGMELIGMTVVFPVLAMALGAGPGVFGYLNAITGLAAFGPLLFAHRMEPVRRKKRLVFYLGLGIRLPILVAGACLAFLEVSWPLLALFLIALCYLISQMSMMVNAPPWMDLMAETIPKSRMGRMMGYRNGVSAGMALLAGPICGVVVSVFGFPTNYVILYLFSFSILMISWFLFDLVDEIPDRVEPPAKTAAHHYFRDLGRAVSGDRSFRFYLLYKGLNAFSISALPFLSMAAVRVYGMEKGIVVGGLLTTSAIGRIAGNFTLPYLAEKAGHRSTLTVGAIFRSGAMLLAALAPSGQWFLGVLLLWGFGMGALSVSDFPLVMTIAPRGRRVGYTTMMMTVIAPISIIGAPVAGNVMESLGHRVLFLSAGILLLLAIGPLLLTRSERGYVRNPSVHDF